MAKEEEIRLSNTTALSASRPARNIAYYSSSSSSSLSVENASAISFQVSLKPPRKAIRSLLSALALANSRPFQEPLPISFFPCTLASHSRCFYQIQYLCPVVMRYCSMLDNHMHVHVPYGLTRSQYLVESKCLGRLHCRRVLSVLLLISYC